MNGDGPEVLRVIDARDRACQPHRGWPPLMDWIREHGADPDDVTRIEVLLLDCPFARLVEAVRDEQGRLQVVPAPDGDGLILATTTRDVLLRRMPPERQAAA